MVVKVVVCTLICEIERPIFVACPERNGWMHDEDEDKDDEGGWWWWFVSRWYGVKEVEVVGLQTEGGLRGIKRFEWSVVVMLVVLGGR